MFCLTTPLEHIDFYLIIGYWTSFIWSRWHTFLERNPLPPHRATLFDKQQGIFYMHFSIDRTVHTTAFDKPVVDHWLERKIAQTAAGSTEKDRSDDRPLQMQTRYRLSYIPLPSKQKQQSSSCAIFFSFHLGQDVASVLAHLSVCLSVCLSVYVRMYVCVNNNNNNNNNNNINNNNK